ncbi:MAG: hydantoinase B/oxoprolinase family protein [Acidimicrobiia bacterium]|nr:hydantoinase B/oxoprolinase family protein [Acidimicrobiia bacterium]
MNHDIDPFQLEVIRHSFDAIAEDMSLTLMRTAHSGIVRDSLDFSTSICDALGQPLAQGICTPMQLGSFYDAMLQLIADYSGRIFPGDVFLANDPYAAAGQHLPDLYIAMPIFEEDRVVAWSTTIAHHSDVGGIVAGSNAIGAEEIFQEGLRLPIVKFVEAGKRNEALWDVIALNVRTPEKVLGDLQAQMAACTSGEREMQELFRRYGTSTVLRYAEYLHDYTERLTRAELREIPEGTYRFTDHLDGLGANPEPIVLQVAVTIRDGRALVDWSGSSPQVKGGINPSFPFTKACAYTAFRSILNSDLPTCHGFTRAIEVRAPLGSLLNPTFPAPCGARGVTGFRMIDCLMGAMATAVPDRVTADTSGGSTLPTIAGYLQGKPFVFCETFLGTWGGTSAHDGQNGVPHMGANQTNVPVEMIESDYPIRIERYGLAPDTAGPGRYRGGLSLMREYRILCDEAILSIRSDKRRYPPHGLFGGGAGAPSLNLVNPQNETKLLPVLMTEVERLKRGDVYLHVMAGGGGYGDPLERDPLDVLDDVAEEKVTIRHAAEAYGVVIVTDPVLRIDDAATERLRCELRASKVAEPRS